MKLSEIVAFKNLLDNLASVPLVRLTANSELTKIMQFVGSQTFGITEEYHNDIVQTYNQLQLAFDLMHDSVQQFHDQLQKVIAHRALHYYVQSTNLYSEKINLYGLSGFYKRYRGKFGVFKTLQDNEKDYVYIQKEIDSILNQKLNYTDNFLKIIENRVLAYADWHYPAAVIRPSNVSFLNTLVANDPLYLIDEHMDLLSPILIQFNSQYQNRLRPYVVNEISPFPILLSVLPKNQFGFFLAVNYFNYRPIEIIKIYLEEIYQLLRPGGVVGMTFNNCDNHDAIGLMEDNNSYYTPGHMVLEIAKNIGYQCVCQYNDTTTSWIELQKPGGLSSLRGGQTLAKINHK